MADEEHPELEELREEIDKVDYKILEKLGELLRDRFKISEKIGLYKRKVVLGVTDAVREETVLRDRAEQGHRKGVPREVARSLFKAVIEESKGKQ